MRSSNACGHCCGSDDEPPLTQFLAEQLGTAHWFDPQPAATDLGWTPTVTIDEGLRRLADWYSVRNHTTPIEGAGRYPRRASATWQSGSCNGLQSRVPGFNSRRRLRKPPGHGPRRGRGHVVVTENRTRPSHGNLASEVGQAPCDVAATSRGRVVSPTGDTARGLLLAPIWFGRGSTHVGDACHPLLSSLLRCAACAIGRESAVVVWSLGEHRPSARKSHQCATTHSSLTHSNRGANDRGICGP